MTTLSTLSAGMTVEGIHVLITEKSVGTTKKGAPYVDLSVRDKTGSLKCKIWDFDDSSYHNDIAIGKVICISVVISTYQNELQGIIGKWRPSSIPVSTFIKSTKLNKQEMWEDCMNAAFAMKRNTLVRYAACELLLKYKPAIMEAPAATKQHNAWNGGLLEHTWNMLKLAEMIYKHYVELYAAVIKKDYLTFGVLCHDLFKIDEYDYMNPAFPTTGSGLLVNHIVKGPAVIYHLAEKFMDNTECKTGPANIVTEENKAHDEIKRERDELMHLVASHHGTREFGSPVVPVTLEAVLLHQIDMIDSHFMHPLELIEGKEGSIPGFSERSWTEKVPYLQRKASTCN